MAGESAGVELHNHFNTLYQIGVVGSLTDAQLLQRFVTAHEGAAHAAFTALVERHGPMVLRVCQHVLGDSHDAQDAFQATFLVLARKASSIRKAESVASWLHGVALRIGRRAKVEAVRRRVYERRSATMRAAETVYEQGRSESQSELHEEVARLPWRYREAVVLCYLEGLTTEAAAERIGCPQGTVLSRLSRARERLRGRLAHRALAPPVALLTAWLAPEAMAALPATLLDPTVQVALRFAGRQATKVASASVTATTLAQGVIDSMMISKLKIVFAATLACASALGGMRTSGQFGGRDGSRKPDAASRDSDPSPSARASDFGMFAAAQVPTRPEKGIPSPPKITIVSPADEARMTGATRKTAPKVLKFAIRVEAKDDQWKPDSLTFRVVDSQDVPTQFGSIAMRVGPKQCDGQHLIEGELKFVSLPPGKYLVGVTAYKGNGLKENSKNQTLSITDPESPQAKVDNPPPKADRPQASIPTDSVFMKAIALTDDIARPYDRALALSRIARAQAFSGDNEASQRTFALAINLVDKLSSDESHYSGHILSWIGQSQLMAGDRAGAVASYRKAAALMSAMFRKDGRFDSNSYFNFIPYQLKAGDLAGARETVEKARQAMAEAKNQPFHDGRGLGMIELEALVGEYEPAFRAIAANEAGPNPQYHFKVYALEAICRSVGYAEPPGGEAALERILREIAKSKGINMADEANLRLAVAEAAAKIGAIDLALRAVDSVKEVPSQVSHIRINFGRVLTEIVKAQAKAGQRDQAKATLARAIQFAETFGKPPSGNGVLHYVREAQIETGDFTEALRPLQGENPQTLWYRQLQVARLQEKAGDRDAAKKIRTQALADAEAYLRDLKPEPPQSTRELRYSIPRQSFEERKGLASSQIVYLKAELGDVNGAFAMAQVAENPMAYRNALSAVATAQGRSGDVDAAASWIRGLKEPEARVWCIQALASGLVERYTAPELASKPRQ